MWQPQPTWQKQMPLAGDWTIWAARARLAEEYMICGRPLNS